MVGAGRASLPRHRGHRLARRHVRALPAASGGSCRRPRRAPGRRLGLNGDRQGSLTLALTKVCRVHVGTALVERSGGRPPRAPPRCEHRGATDGETELCGSVKMKIVCTLRLINFNFYTALLGRVCLFVLCRSGRRTRPTASAPRPTQPHRPACATGAGPARSARVSMGADSSRQDSERAKNPKNCAVLLS